MRFRIWEGCNEALIVFISSANPENAMNAGKKILFGLFALFVFFPLTFAQSSTARAQQYSSSFTAPKISGFDVEQVRQLVAGTELNFTLYVTPGGIAIVSIPGGTGGL